MEEVAPNIWPVGSGSDPRGASVGEVGAVTHGPVSLAGSLFRGSSAQENEHHLVKRAEAG